MKELGMKSNDAYGSVKVHYDEVDYHNKRPQHDTNEYIYEQPAL